MTRPARAAGTRTAERPMAMKAAKKAQISTYIVRAKRVAGTLHLPRFVWPR